VEEHDVAAPFQAPAFNIPLPATNLAPLPAPLASPNNLKIEFVDVAPFSSLNGEILPRMTIKIVNSSTADLFEVFDNPLDTNLQYPIRLDLSLYLQELGLNEQLVVYHRYEASDDILPFAAFGEVAPPSGRGSLADPLRLQLGLPASAATGDFTNGDLKILLYYTSETADIPEPAAWMLSLMGLGLVSMLRRRGC
jgi:hypothetical protein